MDCLKPGDIVILTTPPAFRWVQFSYAIAKGLNVFMEKPVTVDGPTSKKMLKLAEDSVAKNLKVGVGLMSRHSRALQELLAHPGRRNRRRHPHARLPDARAGGAGFPDQVAGEPERTALADQELPRVPVGQRRLLQRLLYPSLLIISAG